ncbi:hypothetical protein BABINDRAFT_162823 [Babjeviella inositovora NRRL Y-12698]|uniref:Autophagy-related protein n=1 Tax=Babjeviella inositovora NRRL Y-12698 TaxID=984486 RepID=A0A1E3QKH4_9ASCO|nr:uncharacterized protein BABINDRAFT_162823 [Babjeviella inositovora NRRL Y-12698]ODQ78150.1 hypothetical protein BABINDRAFT_162823 [Babjeviella inositovora NRRL Y-12698]
MSLADTTENLPLAAASDSLLDDYDFARKYPEQDTSPTSKQEIFGWCCYSWSSEPFIVSAVGTFVPLLLEQFARLAGFRLDDNTKPCVSAPETDNPIPPGLAPPGLIPPGSDKCVLPLFGHFIIDTSSLALYTFSASIFLQALIVISMSGMADRSHFRKSILVVFGILGALTTMAFLGVSYKHYIVASLLAMLANCCFGAVNVCGNAFLAILVSNYPQNSVKVGRDGEFITEANISDTKNQLSSQISGTGAACGYTAALVAQLIAILIVKKFSNPVLGSSTFAIQAAIFFIGCWWLVFQIPVILLMRLRPGPPLHLDETELSHKSSFGSSLYRLSQYTKYGWVTLAQTAMHAQKLRQIMMFLLAWFFVSDSLTTINSTAILFARSNLQMDTTQLGIVGLLTVMFAILGSLVVPNLIRRCGLLAKSALCGAVALACFIPLYGIVGFFTTSFGLHHAPEMFMLAMIYGIVLGSVATLTRSIFSTLIPVGLESTFFSLFAVTDKGSSVIGPIISGLIVDSTHELRYCFVWLLFGLLAGLAILWWGVDLEQGVRDGEAFTEEA